MKTGTLFLTDDPSVTLTCYLHEDSGEMPNVRVRPAVLVLPGGGYKMCSDREAEPVALAYMAEGFHVFVLRYTVGEKSVFPKPLTDAELALGMIQDRAEEWRIDPVKIAVTGFSAGGHLAAALCTMGKVKPSALILGYPCILESLGKILANPVPGLDDKVDAATPPTFLFTTSDDELVPVENTLAFASALERAKVPFELHVFRSGSHGLSLAKPHTSSGMQRMVNGDVAQWLPLSVRWLNSLWGEFDHSKEQVVQGVLFEFDAYGIDVAVERLWESDICKALLLSYIPALEDAYTFKQARLVSPRVIASYAGDALPQSALMELDEKLRAISVK